MGCVEALAGMALLSVAGSCDFSCLPSAPAFQAGHAACGEGLQVDKGPSAPKCSCGHRRRWGQPS